MGNPKYRYSEPRSEPKKTEPPVSLNVPIPADLHARMVKQAGKHFLSVERIVTDALKEEVKRWENLYK